MNNKINFRKFIFALLLCIFSKSLIAQSSNISKLPARPIAPIKYSTKRMTAFIPAIHSFKFANTFNGVDGSRRWGGLCAGMSYAVLDYYFAGMLIPQQTYAPANRYPLQSYLFDRHTWASNEANIDRWIELGFNPGGVRTAEFFGWGLEMKSPGDRMSELKISIDRGIPVPLGLYHSDEAKNLGYKSGDHEVVAIGYDFGRYKGDKGQFIEDFQIFISDPNYPGVIKILIADNVHKFFYYKGEKTYAWMTYFVDKKYDKKVPPNFTQTEQMNTTLYAKFTTGKDDLRGGNDNLSVTIKFKDGSKQYFPNVNKSATWISDYEEIVPLTLNRRINGKQDVENVLLECSFGGGFNGDNWDLKFFVITGLDELQKYVVVEGTLPINERLLVKRFTEGDKVYKVDIR